MPPLTNPLDASALGLILTQQFAELVRQKRSRKLRRNVNRIPTSSSANSSNGVNNKEIEKLSQKLLSIVNISQRIYSDYDFHDKVRDANYLPVDLLHERTNKLLKEQDENNKMDFDTALIKVLLSWFKDEYFNWFNFPKCANCNDSEMKFTSDNNDLMPNPEDLKYGANRIEVYKCDSCGNMVRFPRYNDPFKLMETRIGRCGEWANVFTAFCYILGFETRYILDLTDHVWTEVKINDKWIHLDSCEKAFDTPKLYEEGWGKKLTYIFAISPYSIVDVTPRYSTRFSRLTFGFPDNNVGRRQDYLTVQSLLRKLNNGIRNTGMNQRMLTVKLSQELELSELNETSKLWKQIMDSNFIRNDPTKSDNSSNLPARESGDVDWKESRGENGKK